MAQESIPACTTQRLAVSMLQYVRLHQEFILVTIRCNILSTAHHTHFSLNRASAPHNITTNIVGKSAPTSATIYSVQTRKTDCLSVGWKTQGQRDDLVMTGINRYRRTTARQHIKAQLIMPAIMLSPGVQTHQCRRHSVSTISAETRFLLATRLYPGSLSRICLRQPHAISTAYFSLLYAYKDQVSPWDDKTVITNIYIAYMQVQGLQVVTIIE